VTLPWLGLGLSTNAAARDTPHPFELSGYDYLEYSAPIDFDRALRETSLFAEMLGSGLPLLFHPVELNLYGPELESAGHLERLNDHLTRVRSPWVSNDVAWWHAGGRLWPGYQYVAPPLTEQGLDDCTAHALHVQSAIEVPLFLENPSVIARRGELHVLDFMARLHARTGCLLLLDLGHLLAYQLTSGLPARTALDGFPLDAVAELHLAGGMIASRGERTFYFDAHAEPIREVLFELLAELAPRCPNLRGLTYEADGHSPEMAQANLQRLRSLVTPRPPFGHAIQRSEPPPLSSEAWQLARAAFVGPDPWDPLGATVEREYRLGVASSELDPFNAELADAFVRSPEFLHAFETGQALPESFMRWARARLFGRA
jgi:uncharacterized protein